MLTLRKFGKSYILLIYKIICRRKGIFYLSYVSGHYKDISYDIGDAYLLSANKWTIKFSQRPQTTKDGK